MPLTTLVPPALPGSFSARQRPAPATRVALTLLGAFALAGGALPASAASPAPAAGADRLATLAEQSGYQRTGRYDEVAALCLRFQRAYPRQVRCFEFGRTPEGRPMLALAASATGALTPDAARQRGLPVVLVQGGIHAGEIDGKDAGFAVLRDALQGRVAAGALARQVMLFVPVFNVDGHERFGRWNRPNQRGPEAMGWRVTGQNFNLNRDYMKADAPEMQAMLRLVQAWDPLATIDLHVTDGAQFEHDVSIQVEPGHAGDPALGAIGRRFRDAVIADLARAGSLPLPFYPSFVVEDDPSSGFEDTVPPPRFSTGYFALRNRFGMLVETHSWKDYPTRVAITKNTVIAVLEQVARHGQAWRAATLAADAAAAQMAGTRQPLTWRLGDRVRTIDFRGYAYTRTPSDVSGALMTRYDETRPQVWRIPLRDENLPAIEVDAPAGGYIVPAAWAPVVAPKLALHGVQYRSITAAASLPVEAFRAEQAKFEPQSFESRQRLALTGRWAAETRSIPAGSLFVPIAQPRARLAMGLLEPQAPDALVAWGFFNNAFEKKEAMEDYVAEDVARAMLAADPALAAAFRQKLADDPAFARNPAARLEFFARRHSSWDERYLLYPVLRSAAAPK